MVESKITPRYGAPVPGFVIFECPSCKRTTQVLEGQPPPRCLGWNIGSRTANKYHFELRMRAIR